MDAKTYLMQVRTISARLKYIDSIIEKLRADIESETDVSLRSPWPDGQPRGTITTDPTGTTASRLADKVCARREQLREQLLDYEYQQIQTRSDLWSKQAEILDVIGEVRDPVLFNILVSRYVDGRRFEWIAVHVNYTYRHVINLHGKALAEVQTILDNRFAES